eukprot:CAMPEP_0195053530 /NCGR_PEP_ID=MMETSP0448-20130528/2614_1 /TAXON_ID=66468 /ORGANISM="Heterocapsa triquestra, Strain CCMP 448" /LENGTH=51 /DNA_ID=CAMNT_0040082825 /DNA_START=85 /DNA_END=236 /DNA_ORIENTATION=-
MTDWLGQYDNATSFLYTRSKSSLEARDSDAPDPKSPVKHLLTMCDLSKDEV